MISPDDLIDYIFWAIISVFALGAFIISVAV